MMDCRKPIQIIRVFWFNKRTASGVLQKRAAEARSGLMGPRLRPPLGDNTPRVQEADDGPIHQTSCGMGGFVNALKSIKAEIAPVEMDKLPIHSDRAPKAIGPYSQAVLECFRYRLELSGQIGIDPSTGQLVEGLEGQTRRVLDNIAGVLSEIGWGFGNIIKARIYLTDMKDYKAVNEIYAERFGASPPSRAAVAVSQLPMGASVEIECSAGGDEVSEAAREKYKIEGFG